MQKTNRPEGLIEFRQGMHSADVGIVNVTSDVCSTRSIESFKQMSAAAAATADDLPNIACLDSQQVTLP